MKKMMPTFCCRTIVSCDFKYYSQKFNFILPHEGTRAEAGHVSLDIIAKN